MDETAESLLNRGYQARREHRLADARQIYTEAVDLCRESNDQVHLAQSLTRLGGIERDLGEIEASLLHYQEAVAICRTLDDPLRLAHTVRHVGDILRESNQLAPALPCYEEALAIYRSYAETDSLDLANTLRGYALLNSALGEYRKAAALWKEVCALYAHANVQAGVAESEYQTALMLVLIAAL